MRCTSRLARRGSAVGLHARPAEARKFYAAIAAGQSLKAAFAQEFLNGSAHRDRVRDLAADDGTARQFHRREAFERRGFAFGRHFGSPYRAAPDVESEERASHLSTRSSRPGPRDR